MSNVNSLTLTGGAAISRFEHSVGTAVLALAHAEANGLPERLRRHLSICCLLHDVGSAAFGHTIQYVLDSHGYSHENLIDLLTGRSADSSQFRYQHATLEAIYFGQPRALRALLSSDDLHAISHAVQGRGELGPLVSGTLDLDNIDNVFRLGYHMGIVQPGDVPMRLACAISLRDGQLVLEKSDSALVECWYDTRRILYDYLLLNPDEFAAKCMLDEAANLAVRLSEFEFKWQDVDFGLIEKLHRASDPTRQIVTRLMLGDLYGCLAIYDVPGASFDPKLHDFEARQALELAVTESVRKHKRALKSASIAILCVTDNGRSRRRIEFEEHNGRKYAVGRSSDRVLIGVFFRNTTHSSRLINREKLRDWGVTHLVTTALERHLGIERMTEHEPYTE